jgi:hypothetical protein
MASVAMLAFPLTAAAAPTVVEESGALAECAGSSDGTTAFVSLYENSAYPDLVAVGIETSDGELVGSAESEAGLTSGVVDIGVDLVDAQTGTSAGTATLTGTATASGSSLRIHQPAIRDNGLIVVSSGTNTPLSVDLALEFEGTTVPLVCDAAFAFDLTTRKQPIANR